MTRRGSGIPGDSSIFRSAAFRIVQFCHLALNVSTSVVLNGVSNLLGVGQNNPLPGRSLWHNLGANNMSYLFEAGYVPSNFLGLGPGGYRVQPFVATVDGVSQAGVGLNINQQLGPQWGCFGRLGVGGTTVTNIQGASTQLATGLILQHPLYLAGILSESSNNFLGFGFVWSQPSQRGEGIEWQSNCGRKLEA
jgi:hypothetical protein